VLPVITRIPRVRHSVTEGELGAAAGADAPRAGAGETTG
jgi:hypothetical protein